MLVGVDQQIAVGPVLVASHAAPQLVQVGQPVAIGFVDEDGVGVGDVQPAFDDRRGQQQIELLVDEIDHHLLQLALRHLAVADARSWLPERCTCSRCATASMSCTRLCTKKIWPPRFSSRRTAWRIRS